MLPGFFTAVGISDDGPVDPISSLIFLGGGRMRFRLVLLKLDGGRTEHRSRRGTFVKGTGTAESRCFLSNFSKM